MNIQEEIKKKSVIYETNYIILYKIINYNIHSNLLFKSESYINE